MTKYWFQHAIRDLKLARFVFETGDEELFEPIAFHLQQCIEKSLKAYLVFNGVRVSKTHDLYHLSQAVLKVDDSLGFLRDQAELLRQCTQYAVAHRYPDAAVDLEPPTESQIKEILKLSERVYGELRSRVGE